MVFVNSWNLYLYSSIRANWHSSPIVHLAMALERFVITPLPTIKKVRSKGVTMYAYGVSVYYAHIESQMDLGGAVRNECNDWARVEFCPRREPVFRSLKGYTTSTNLAIHSPRAGILIIALSNRLCTQQLCRLGKAYLVCFDLRC